MKQLLFLLATLVYPQGKVAVLTFDDAVASHATYVAPLLKKYGFGATFFVCEFPPDFSDKSKYMTWEQIQSLHQMGFEVANHTRTHKHVSKMTSAEMHEQLEWIERKFLSLGIPRPISFAYPGYDTHPPALEVLKARGYQYASGGGERAYEPAKDDPLLMPGINIHGTDPAKVIAAIDHAGPGRIAVLIAHGVPDTAHPWVDTRPALFERYLEHLKASNFRVIAMRDLADIVKPTAPATPAGKGR
jgi:peptidoglycan/xylan/chitin deacetylase (PgdA/CDA1 family)